MTRDPELSQLCHRIAWSRDTDFIPYHTDSTEKDKVFCDAYVKTES